MAWPLSWGWAIVSPSDDSVEIDQYVRRHRDVITDVLRHSDDPYARACALVLLKHGGDEPELDEVIQELEQCRQ